MRPEAAKFNQKYTYNAPMDNEISHRLTSLLDGLTRSERSQLFGLLRQEFPIHDLERRLNVSAEVILEAISRASDLTLRGIRGIIAEAAFKQYEIARLIDGGDWTDRPLIGDLPYDFAVCDDEGEVTIQVKMQRQKEQRPMRACEANRRMFASLTDQFVVETQRTRGGRDRDGNATRPYRFGEFNILAVAMHPSTGSWADFLFTLERWLIPSPGVQHEVFKYQPVATAPNRFWTADLTEAIRWLRSDTVYQLPTDPAGW